MNSLLDASIAAIIGFAAVGLVTTVFRRMPASVRCWLWRLAFAKAVLSLFWIGALPVASPRAPSTEKLDEPAVGMAMQQAGPASTTEVATPIQSDVDVISIIWCVGMALGVTVALTKSRQQCRGNAAPQASATANKLAREMGVAPPPVIAKPGAAMAIHGLVRPVVVVSEDSAELEPALAHEIAHLRRRDPLWSMLVSLAALPFWFLPPVWFALRAYRDATEEATDAMTVESGVSKSALAEALVKLSAPRSSFALALGGGRKTIEWRIRKLYAPKWNAASGRRALAALALPLACLLVPWQAVARDLDGPANLEDGSLDRKALTLMAFPSVRADLQYSDQQFMAKHKENAEWQQRWNAFAAKLTSLQRQHRYHEKDALDQQTRQKLFRERDEIFLSALTPQQLTRLRQLGMQLFGIDSLVDSSIAAQLALTESQKNLLTQARSSLLISRKKARTIVNRQLGMPDLEDMNQTLSSTDRETLESLKRRLSKIDGKQSAEIRSRITAIEMRALNNHGSYKPISPAHRKVIYRDATIQDRQIRKAATQRFLSTLTAKQQQKWNELIGKPGRFDILDYALGP